jgi:hypothetical protein
MNHIFNDENSFPDFEKWHEQNKQFLPKELNKEINENAETYGFLFFWKHYEKIVTPKFHKLLELQFPLLYNAEIGFREKSELYITLMIFEFSEYVWSFAISNRKGLQPIEVMPVIYDLALNSKTFDPSYVKLNTMDDVSDHVKHLGEEFNRKIIEEANADLLKRAERLTKFNKQVIDVFQTDLFEILPELFNMDVEWWKCYKFTLEFECGMWRERNERLEFIIKNGFGAEWIEKPFTELMVEIEKKILPMNH